MWLNFIIFNAVADLPNLHLISDAGAGEGLMQLHPSRDSELIACGKANTLLNGQYLPSPIAVNNAVTPAILVHGIFKALQQHGYQIRLHCYQLGLDHRPDFTDSCIDQIIIKHCPLGKEKQLVEQSLLPELIRQSRAGEKHLIAESGIGGTTYANLWLRHWLNIPVNFAGSTKDPKKLAVKENVLNELVHKTALLPLDTAPFIANLKWSDPVQRACCALLASDIKQINFAGGAMIFAPIIAMQSKLGGKKITIGTTRWVMEALDAQYVVNHLPTDCYLMTPKINFNLSHYESLKMYERGYVIEGCGLGACLVFAEQQGISRDELITHLDAAVAPWLILNAKIK